MGKNEIKKVYSDSFKVRSYEVDKNGKASLAVICNYFQEIAGAHAHYLQFDISQLHEKGLTWVLYKMHVVVDTLPKRWDEVKVTTWPSPGDGLRAFRDYELYTSDANRTARAVSQWMVLDMKSRRPVRIPKEIMELGLDGREHTLSPDKSPIKSLKGDGAEFITSVGLQDLDMNNHVNNVKYIEWMTGYVDSSDLNERVCKEVDIQYISEARHLDNIYHTCEVIAEENSESMITLQHSLFSGANKKPVASAVTRWVSDHS